MATSRKRDSRTYGSNRRFSNRWQPSATDHLLMVRRGSTVLEPVRGLRSFLCFAVASSGGVSRCDPNAVSRQLRRTPYDRADYLYPIDLVLERAGSSR